MNKFRDIIKTHSAMVRRIATVYERDSDRVDDLEQEVWLAVWQALARLEDPATLRAYVARIAQNICVTHVRRAVVRKTQPLTESIRDRADLPDDSADRSRQLERLLEGVRSLPDNLKIVAGLYLEGLPVKEIAEALGISESNASVRLHRAKAALRSSLGDYL